MAERTHLRAVTTDEKAKRQRKAMTVTEAAKSGTPRDLLVATRDRIAVTVENPNTPARDLAALTKRLMETAREIEAIAAREAVEVAGADAVEDGDFDASAV